MVDLLAAAACRLGKRVLVGCDGMSSLVGERVLAGCDGPVAAASLVMAQGSESCACVWLAASHQRIGAGGQAGCVDGA